MPKVIAVIPVLPKPRNLARLRDLLSSLQRHEPGRVRVLLLVDSTETAACDEVLRHSGLPGEIMINPRGERGNPLTGGLIVGELAAFQKCADQTDWQFVLKIDDDALVLAPFIDRLVSTSQAHPEAGLLGYYEAGTPLKPGEYNWTSGAFYRRSKLLRRNEDVGGWWFSAWGWRRRVRLLLKEALKGGYLLGEWCGGGAYALTAKTVRELVKHPRLKNPRVFAECHFSEDFFFAIVTHAVGLDIWYEDHTQKIFAIGWQRLPFIPTHLLENGYALVHSVKAESEEEEQTLRAELCGESATV